MLKRFKHLLPSREQLHINPWTRWLAPYLHHPRLWHWSRRGVAFGVAIGVFFGLLIPIAQIPVSVAAAIVLRVNVPAAAASTLVTNPITFGPVYYAAYRIGAAILAPEQDAAETETSRAATLAAQDAGLWQRLTALGKPLLLGLAIMASLCGLLTYVVISAGWAWWVWRKRRKRLQSRAGPPGR